MCSKLSWTKIIKYKCFEMKFMSLFGATYITFESGLSEGWNVLSWLRNSSLIAQWPALKQCPARPLHLPNAANARVIGPKKNTRTWDFETILPVWSWWVVIFVQGKNKFGTKQLQPANKSFRWDSRRRFKWNGPACGTLSHTKCLQSRFAKVNSHKTSSTYSWYQW